jgi:SNF2 family DNA or RNA helicase
MAHWERPIHPSSYKYVVTFGKYKGLTYGDLRERHSGFLEQISGSFAFPEKVRIAAAKVLMGESLEGLELPTQLPNVQPFIPTVGRAEMWYVEKDKTIGCRFKANDQLRDRLKHTINGFHWNDEGGYYEFNPEHLPRAVEIFGGKENIKVTDNVKALYTLEVKRRKKLDSIRVKEDSEFVIPGLLVPLYPYQTVAVEFIAAALNSDRSSGCFEGDQMGLGKTPTAIATALHLKAKTIIVCPKTIKRTTWKKQILKFTGQVATIWDNDGIDGDLSAQFHVIHYDIVHKNIKAINEQGFELLVCDEATRLKNYKSIRTKAVLGNWIERGIYPGIKAKWFLPMSGTPMKKRPGELFSLLHRIDKRRFANPKTFLERYEGESGHAGQNLLELNDITKDVMIRRTRIDVKSELPPKQRFDLDVELNDSEMERYFKFENELFRKWNLNGHPSAIQMPSIRNFLFEFKFPRAIEFIDEMLESGRNVLVFAIQVEHVDRIAEHYADLARKIHGQVSQNARDKAVEDLQTGKARVGVMTLATGGEGVDGLQDSMDAVLFMDMWFIPGDHEQAEDRLNRQGQKSRVQAWYMKALNTYDEPLWQKVDETLKTIETATDGKVITEAREKSVFKDVVKMLAQMRNAKLEGLDEAA